MVEAERLQIEINFSILGSVYRQLSKAKQLQCNNGVLNCFNTILLFFSPYQLTS